MLEELLFFLHLSHFLSLRLLVSNVIQRASEVNTVRYLQYCSLNVGDYFGFVSWVGQGQSTRLRKKLVVLDKSGIRHYKLALEEHCP